MFTRERIDLQLNEGVFAELVPIETRVTYQIPPGYSVFVLNAQGAITAGPADWKPNEHAQALLSRTIVPFEIAFDTLRSADRQFIDFCLHLHAAIDAGNQFCVRFMNGRPFVTCEELRCSIQRAAKGPVRSLLQSYQANRLVDDVTQKMVASSVICALEDWARLNGLKLHNLGISDCSPTVDAMLAKVELEKVKAEAGANLEHFVGRISHDLQLSRDRRAQEVLASPQTTIHKLEALLQHFDARANELHEREKRRCQQCDKTVDQNETLFTCRHCGRSCCSAHQAKGEMCTGCEEEYERGRPENKTVKCPISGHCVSPRESFECTQCGKTACTHCYNSETRTCVACAADAASSKAEAGIHALKTIQRMLQQVRDARQFRDLRVLCDSCLPVVRGIGVAPRCDTRSFCIGQKLEFRVFSEHDVYLRLFVVQSDGCAAPLFPNEHCADYFIRGGQEFSFPSLDSTFEFFAKAPGGLDTLVAVAALGPFNLFHDDRLLLGDVRCAPAESRILGPEEVVTLLEKLVGRVQSGHWTCAQCRILVQE